MRLLYNIRIQTLTLFYTKRLIFLCLLVWSSFKGAYVQYFISTHTDTFINNVHSSEPQSLVLVCIFVFSPGVVHLLSEPEHNLLFYCDCLPPNFLWVPSPRHAWQRENHSHTFFISVGKTATKSAVSSISKWAVMHCLTFWQ